MSTITIHAEDCLATAVREYVARKDKCVSVMVGLTEKTAIFYAKACSRS